MKSDMSRAKDLTSGFGCLLEGFTFLISRPRLWKWAIMPTLINLILLIVMIAAFAHYYGDIYAWLTAHLGSLDIENPAHWYTHVADALLWVLNLLFQILIVILSLILLLIVSYVLGLIIASPFNDALSERVETLVSGTEPPPFAWTKFIKDLVRTVRIEAVKAAILLAIPVVLFVLNIIPVVGSPLYVALTLLFGSWDLGFAYADLPMGRRVLPFRERVAFGLKNKWAMVGLGSAFVIPFFNLIFVAPMVVGGTLLYIELQQRK